MIIDAVAGVVSDLESTEGVVGFVSWRRLVQVLRDAGEIKISEKLISFRVGDDGVYFRVVSHHLK